MMQANCENCGAGLSLQRYQDTLTCTYCSTVHVPALREAGHVQKLEDVSSDLACPLCDRHLAPARIERWPLLVCPSCHGLLIRGDELLAIVHYCRRDAAEPFREPEPVDPAQLARELNCPQCDRRMSAHPYYGPGHFVIDSCRGCGRIWLDAGELGKAAEEKWVGTLWR